jgi:nitrogen fixation/metabolism regulation signal transduction histidine kinase
VTDHGGTLELTNRRPTGALVRITLPGAIVDGVAPTIGPSA